jgi:predicted ATPase
VLFEIGLTHFKPFGTEQRARLAPITLIYGPNSGGKSSIIQALMLLRQTLEGSGEATGLIPRGSLVDLGSFKALIHRHDLDRPLKLRFSFDPIRTEVRSPSRGFVSQDYSRTVELTYASAASDGKKRRDSSELTETRYCLEGPANSPMLDLRLSRSSLPQEEEVLFAPIDVRGENGVFSLKDEAAQTNLVSYFLELDRRASMHRRGREPIPEETLLSESELNALLSGARVYMEGGVPARLVPQRFASLGFPTWLRSYRYRVVEGIAREFTQLIASLAYLGPLRSHPERHYVISGGTPASVGKRGEFTPQMLHRRKNVLTPQVNRWFARFGIPYRLETKELEDEVTGSIVVMSLEDQQTRVTVAPSDVGFGIGQLLPILVEGLVAEGRVICVEQPEIHLHPRLQAHLADFFVATSATDRPDDKRPAAANQWIVETHSEALMLRIQKHIRMRKLAANNVSVLYVSPGPEGSSIRQLRLDDDGEFIDPWPHGFFEERFDDLFGPS